MRYPVTAVELLRVVPSNLTPVADQVHVTAWAAVAAKQNNAMSVAFFMFVFLFAFG